jgi:ATP/maltotriose-dependent transcriptional regulator MalT
MRGQPVSRSVFISAEATVRRCAFAPGIYLVFAPRTAYAYVVSTVGASPDAGVLGRDAELERFEALLGAAVDGRSAVHVLRGEAGVGKTTMLNELSERAARFMVLRAPGLEAEADLPFAGLASLLRPILRFLGAIPAPQATALEGALGLGPPGASDPFTISAGTLSLLAAAAEDAPVLAVVDDVQWIDASSTQALVFAGRRLVAEGVVLVFAAREDVPAVLDNARFSETYLGGLDHEAARELLSRIATDLSDEVAEQIIQTSGGNPLALIEIPRLLDTAQRIGSEPLPDPLPVGNALEATYRARGGELSEDGRRALLVAAADGTGALAVVTAALRALGSTSAALEEAEATGLIAVNGEVRFRHPLIRSALYHAATASERRAAHRAIAASIHDDPMRRAAHLARGAAAPDEEIATAIETAAKEARRRHAPSAAARAWEQSARLTLDPPGRIRRLVAAAEAYQLSGQLDRATAILDEAAKGTTDSSLLGEIGVLRGRGEVFRGAPHQAHALLVEQARKVVGEEPGHAAALFTEAAMAGMVAGEAKLAVEAARRAFEIARETGGPEAVAATLTYANALVIVGGSAEASTYLERVAPLESIDPMAGPPVLQLEVGISSTLCQFDEARALGERLVAAGREASAPGLLPFPLSALADIDYRTGRWTIARAEAQESYVLASETGQSVVSYARIMLARVEAAMGLDEDCQAHVGEALAIAERLGADAITFYADAVLGLLELGLGRFEQAVLYSERATTASRERGVGEPALLMSAPDLVEAYERLGQREEAQAALEALEEEVQASGGVWGRAAAARVRGLLAPDDEFELPFEEALVLYRNVALPFDEARTELCLGERRRRAGRRADARTPLRKAFSTFDRLGAKPWAERARMELRASGETLRAAPEAAEKLTPQELQVAVVVSRGATNREAAAELFLSPKTIDFHLSRIYRKLGIRSRTQLVSALAADQTVAS